MSLIKIENLSLSINNHEILNKINFKTSAGKILGIIGESGSGKSMTANSIVQLLPKGSKISGKIILENQNFEEVATQINNSGTGKFIRSSDWTIGSNINKNL